MGQIKHANIKLHKGWFFLLCNDCDKKLFKSIKCNYEDKETLCDDCVEERKKHQAETGGDAQWDVLYPGMWEDWSGWDDE
ncbi:MAG: hypothetical protein ACXABY_21620 [Candidatus Thorarchaeota archaeon]|jgi:hypothetical protein